MAGISLLAHRGYMENKKGIFKISINDGYCEYTYSLELSKNLCINDIITRICKRFKVEVPEGVLTKKYDFNRKEPVELR